MLLDSDWMEMYGLFRVDAWDYWQFVSQCFQSLCQSYKLPRSMEMVASQQEEVSRQIRDSFSPRELSSWQEVKEKMQEKWGF